MQVCHCYPEETATFPESIQTLLRQHGTVLHPEVRMSLCRGLILMRNKGFLQTQRYWYKIYAATLFCGIYNS